MRTEIILDRREATAPTVSVVIPARNEARYVKACLDALRSSGVTAPYAEVIVVDNGSRDTTVEICAQEDGADLIVTHVGVISEVRNAGAALARGAFFAFIDADVTVGADWGAGLRTAIDTHILSESVVSGATYSVRLAASWLEDAWFRPMEKKSRSYINGGNLIVHRAAFSRLAGFDPAKETGEDVDLCDRARLLGLSVQSNSELRAVHLGYPSDLRNFFRREVWHGRGDVRNVRSVVRSKVALAALAWCLFLLVSVIGIACGAFGVVLCAILGSLLMSALFGYSVGGINGGARGVAARTLLGSVYFSARAIAIVHRILLRATEASPKARAVTR